MNEQTEADPLTLHCLRLALRLRLDPYQTEDKTGIFDCPDKNVKNRIGGFLPKLLNGVLSLERGLANYGNLDPSQREGLSRLITFLSRVCYYEEKSFDPEEYQLDTSCFLYLPHNSEKNGRSIDPQNYDGQTPAILNFSVINKNKERLERLTFRFFPTQYAYYRGHCELDSADPEEAKQILNERNRDSRKIDDVSALVEQARLTLIPPYFELELTTDQGSVGIIKAELTINDDGCFYLSLHFKDNPDLQTGITIGEIKDDEVSNLKESKQRLIQDKLLRLAKDFMSLKLKEPQKKQPQGKEKKR